MARRDWGSGSLCRRVVRRGASEYVYWRAIAPGGHSVGGRRRKEFQSRSEKAARAWLKQAVARVDRGLAPPGERVTVNVYAQDWLRTTANHVKPSTAAFYRAQLGHFDAIADVPVAALSPAHVRELIATRTAEGYASRTIRGVVQTLALVLRQAMEDGIVERNVAALVKLPKLETKPAQHFTAEQARRFLDVARDDPLMALYALALGTGLRRGEALALTWRDVDTDNRGRPLGVRVRASKTIAGVRVVPLPAFAADSLALVDRKPGPIWTASPSYVSDHFQELCRRAGVPVITFHSLRHTAATLMAEAGVSLEVRRWLLGHTRGDMTMRYSHESDALKREAVEKLGGMVG